MQEHVSELNETRALGASLRDQPPIDVAVPLDGDWHKLTDQPVINPHQPKGGTANQASPESSMNEVSKRRAARRKQDWARAKSMQQTTMNARNNSGEDGRYGRYGGDVPSSVDPTNADVVWAARKQRIQDLIYDDEASVSSLKRELKLLLGYADVARSAASEERCRLAVELNEMVTPLVQEVRRLKRKLAQAEAQPAKADETAPHVDAEEGTGEDTLRSGKEMATCRGPCVKAATAGHGGTRASPCDVGFSGGRVAQPTATRRRRLARPQRAARWELA